MPILPTLKLQPAPDETIQGVSESLRAGTCTAVSVVERCLSEIDRWEEHVHAWVIVDRMGALERARELDRDASSGRWHGPLHGIPIGIKDLIDVAGWPTGAGSERLARDTVQRDALLVKRLRDAGAILLGKTVTTHFACFDPPVTRNPWNLDRTPGGSSSGSAAAVATGMCLAAIGSQTGGSITRPASYCGVAGCKPTFGTIPIDGVYPVSKSLDHPGPISRSVADLALLTEVLSGSPSGLMNARFNANGDRAPRLARVRGLFDERLQPAARGVFESTLRQLDRAGAPLVDASLPEPLADVLRVHRLIMLYEIGQVHRDRFQRHPEDYRPGLRTLIEESRTVTKATYIEALDHQQQLKQAIPTSFGEADILITSATTGPAPDPTTTGDPSFNSPWSFAGLPTVSFPMGLSEDRLPLAIQLVGRHADEPRLFAAAQWCERAISN